eukprot:scaffold95573_cov54-Attheya_sp.AAC.3
MRVDWKKHEGVMMIPMRQDPADTRSTTYASPYTANDITGIASYATRITPRVLMDGGSCTVTYCTV